MPLAIGLRVVLHANRVSMHSPNERSMTIPYQEADAEQRLRVADESRTWPRCEPGFTHFELGASSDYQPTAIIAKRYTPRPGVEKE